MGATPQMLALVLLVGCTRSSPSAQGPKQSPSPIASLSSEVNDGASLAWGVLHREDRITLQPPPTNMLERPYSLCGASMAQQDIDLERENAAALRLAREQTWQTYAFDVLIVPGYVALDATEPVRLTAIARERLELALSDYERAVAPFILTTGGNVHPGGTPFNEALEMKRYLLARGVPEARLLLEPCARHSHTNLRNAGRLMLRSGLSRGVIVTSYDQAMYFGHPRTSSFDGRCMSDLGYLVGALQQIDDHRVAFQPNGRTFDRGADMLDP